MSSVVVCGIPRSGSTLVWQIVQAVLPQEDILKTHPDIWEPDGSRAIVSIRDPHDVVASLYRVRLSRSQKREGDQEDVSSAIRRMLISYDALNKVMKGPYDILRYEEFYHNYSVIFRYIECKLNVQVTSFVQKWISETYSVEANRARASRLMDFNEVDREQIHGDHIGNVHPGSWSDVLPEWAWDQVVKESRPVTREWGYAD